MDLTKSFCQQLAFHSTVLSFGVGRMYIYMRETAVRLFLAYQATALIIARLKPRSFLPAEVF